MVVVGLDDCLPAGSVIGWRFFVRMLFSEDTPSMMNRIQLNHIILIFHIHENFTGH